MFQRYQVLRFLGGPPPDTVCLARDQTTGAEVVLHLLPDGLLAQQAEAAAVLEELVEGLQADPVQGTPTLGAADLQGQPACFTEELVRGESLGRILDRCRHEHRQLPLPVVSTALLRLAQVLVRVHEAGYAHGDVRPEKLLADHQGLTLLGLPWSPFRPWPVSAASAETLSWLPPEGLQGSRPDPRWDLYQLGLVAYSLYAGEPPFPSLSGLDASRRRAKEPLPPVSERRQYFPPQLQELVAQLLERDPARRPSGAQAFITALEAHRRRAREDVAPLIEPKPAPAARAPAPAEPPPRRPRPAPAPLPEVPEPEPTLTRHERLQLLAAFLLFVASTWIISGAPPAPVRPTPRIVAAPAEEVVP